MFAPAAAMLAFLILPGLSTDQPDPAVEHRQHALASQCGGTVAGAMQWGNQILRFR
jgi:hypothetical protein